jgi:glycine cleavage system H lipoate-binding protein
MEGFKFVDIFATKGQEYLIVIGFLTLLALFWRFLSPRPSSVRDERPADLVEWFRVPRGFLFHRGHGWMREAGDLVRVGVDDFAQKLVGRVEAIDLPAVGMRLGQGDRGWDLRAGSARFPMLSPIDGEVVSVNERAVLMPDVVNQDPFGDGWLMEIRPTRLASDRTNLLSGSLARHWIEDAIHSLRLRSGEELGALYNDGGVTMQDGGVPVDGIARALAGDSWESLVKEHLLTANMES